MLSLMIQILIYVLYRFCKLLNRQTELFPMHQEQNMWLIQVLDAMMQNGGALPVAEKLLLRRGERLVDRLPLPHFTCAFVLKCV